MSKFAQYFLTYRDDNLFARLEWEKREDLLASFLADEDGIQFADKSQNESEATDGNDDESGQRIKIYHHRIYHLAENERIIVMRIANVKIIPIEMDFKQKSVEHYPSVFVIFDTRPGCRRVAIQKLSASFSNTDQVAKIIDKANELKNGNLGELTEDQMAQLDQLAGRLEAASQNRHGNEAVRDASGRVYGYANTFNRGEFTRTLQNLGGSTFDVHAWIKANSDLFNPTQSHPGTLSRDERFERDNAGILGDWDY